MKNAIYSLILSCCVLASCDNPLDIVQDNKLTASNMWKTSVHVTTSTNAIYADIRENFVQDDISMLHWGELRVGPYMWGYSHLNKVYMAKEVIENNMTSSSASCRWTKLYNAIDQANAVLKYAPSESIDMKDSDRAWAIGQASFARAYCYFWAVRLWGGYSSEHLSYRSRRTERNLPCALSESRGLHLDRKRYPCRRG